MSYTFPSTLVPALKFLEFTTIDQYSKDIRDLLTPSNIALINPWQSIIDELQTSISNNLSKISTELATVSSELSTIDGWRLAPPSNLPTGWTDDGYDDSDMGDVESAYTSFQSSLTSLQTAMTSLQSVVNEFELHTIRLSGNDLNPSGIAADEEGELNFIALMSVANSWENELHRWGLDNPFDNKIVKIFGSLFTGDVLIANAKVESDKTPVDDVSSYSLTSRMSTDPNNEDSQLKQNILDDISTLVSSLQSISSVSSVSSAISGQMTTDKNYVIEALDFFNTTIPALTIRSFLDDSYRRWIFENIIGSTQLKEKITEMITSGDI